jgi:hypothetical protein
VNPQNPMMQQQVSTIGAQIAPDQQGDAMAMMAAALKGAQTAPGAAKPVLGGGGHPMQALGGMAQAMQQAHQKKNPGMYDGDGAFKWGGEWQAKTTPEPLPGM